MLINVKNNFLGKGKPYMNEVIEKIVIADEQARNKVSTAKSKKDEIRKLSDSKKAQIQNKYMKIARHQIERAKNIDLEKAKANIKNSEDIYNNLSKKLDLLYDKNKDLWVETICNNVISSFSRE